MVAGGAKRYTQVKVRNNTNQQQQNTQRRNGLQRDSVWHNEKNKGSDINLNNAIFQVHPCWGIYLYYIDLQWRNGRS
jgi:hypothetical protein